MEFMEIGLFQFENLFANPNSFRFFDLREKVTPTHPELDPLIAKALRISREEIVLHLEKEKLPKDFPLILIDQSGESSVNTAQFLSLRGFSQIYVVADGVKGLLSEL